MHSENIPLDPKRLENGHVPLADRVKSLPRKAFAHIEKKTVGTAAATAFLMAFCQLIYQFYYSDWLNVGQAEHRQLLAELERPYLPRNKDLSSNLNQNWLFSKELDEHYLVLLGDFNFTSCAWSCFQARGLAASIHSSQESHIIRDLLNKQPVRPGMSRKAWIGLAEMELGMWTHLDHTETDFHSWAWGEPKNENGKEFCAQMPSFGLGLETKECSEVVPFCVCKAYGSICSSSPPT